MSGPTPAPNDLPAGLGAPAMRAFANARLSRLDDFTKVSEAEVKALHGVGPSAVVKLRAALAANGQTFAEPYS